MSGRVCAAVCFASSASSRRRHLVTSVWQCADKNRLVSTQPLAGNRLSFSRAQSEGVTEMKHRPCGEERKGGSRVTQHELHACPGYRNWSSKACASCKSRVPNPSLNQP